MEAIHNIAGIHQESEVFLWSILENIDDSHELTGVHSHLFGAIAGHTTFF